MTSVNIFQGRVGYECSDGKCNELDCCRCHPEVVKIVVEPPTELPIDDGKESDTE